MGGEWSEAIYSKSAVEVLPTANMISVGSEYLGSRYRPDREWLEGWLLERNLGEYDHSNLARRTGGMDAQPPA